MADNTPPNMAIKTGWATTADGYQATRSSEIIKQTLAKTIKDRIMVVLLQKEYQSGNCILVDFDDKQLQIDKPRDWPGAFPAIRVVFKDTAKLWNHFSVKILSETKDTLYTTLPTQLFQLQRRSNFRVDTPQGSKISFSHKKTLCNDFIPLDISANGIKIGTKKKHPIRKNAIITTISITIPDSGQEDGAVTLRCAQGKIVRGFADKQLQLVCYGVQLEPTTKEEDSLIKYVRQRELDMLRKGMKL